MRPKIVRKKSSASSDYKPCQTIHNALCHNALCPNALRVSAAATRLAGQDIGHDIRRRLQLGASRYGAMDIAHPRRPWLLEAYEEALDLIVYLLAESLQRGADARDLDDVGHPALCWAVRIAIGLKQRGKEP